MADAPAVEARRLRKQYRGGAGRGLVLALDGLDLRVPRGATVGLLGPNGSGKSTTIRLLLGLHRPTAGSASVLGLPAGHPDARRRTGYLSEEADLHPFLTARETVETSGALHGMDRAARRKGAEELLERVGLAAALVHGPELLILDEPTAGLDPVGRDGLLALLEDCRGRGTTVLLSSHVLSDVERLCDRVAILGQGRLAAEGTLEEVLRREGSHTLEVLGSDAAVAAARAAAEAAGGSVPSVHPTREPLERVFLRLLGRDRGPAGGGEAPGDGEALE